MPPDPLEHPLAALTAHRLLSAEEEADLIEVMLAGKHARAVLPALSHPTYAATLDQALLGEHARATLVRHNLRLVVAVAKKYLRAAGSSLTLEDLVSFGVIGLLRGLDKFDPEKGQKLSTYVTWWIRQAIGRGIATEGRAIDLPVHIYERLHKQRKARGRLAQQLGREPTPEEVAASLGWKPQQVRQLDIVTQELLSLNVPLRDSDDRTELGDLVPDQRFDPEAAALDSTLRRDLQHAMARLLTEREQRFVRAYFGLDDGEPKTLEAVGKTEGLTRERVRQVLAGAFAKLRDDPTVQGNASEKRTTS
jgi:RNA polymerase primary sigma factor